MKYEHQMFAEIVSVFVCFIVLLIAPFHVKIATVPLIIYVDHVYFKRNQWIAGECYREEYVAYPHVNDKDIKNRVAMLFKEDIDQFKHDYEIYFTAVQYNKQKMEETNKLLQAAIQKQNKTLNYFKC